MGLIEVDCRAEKCIELDKDMSHRWAFVATVMNILVTRSFFRSLFLYLFFVACFWLLFISIL